MTDLSEPPRPRDDALRDELESLRQQERDGHATPKEQRCVEQLIRRLRLGEHGADRQKEEEERARHRR